MLEAFGTRAGQHPVDLPFKSVAPSYPFRDNAREMDGARRFYLRAGSISVVGLRAETNCRLPEESQMPTQLAVNFRAELSALYATLLAVPHELADTPWRAGGWTRKQIIGHMLDSATNNRQRFVRAATEGSFVGPNYDQQPWVAAHGYADQPWETLLRWWQTEHEILAAIVDRIPEERLDASCTVGADAPVLLRFLVEDYCAHQRGHLAQLAPGSQAT
jgi:hypothetical protein